MKFRLHRAQVHLTGIRFGRKAVEDFVDDVHRQAVIRASVGPYTTGYMASTVTKRVWVSGFKVHGSVGSAARHAHWANEGTKPHVIRPRNPSPRARLRFYWRKVGHVVYFAKVNHPGQSGKGWLTGPLRNVALKKGWKVRF